MSEITIKAARESKQWSDERQCYVPLAWHKCSRCNQRKHGRMFEITLDGRPMRVGLNCLVKLINELPVEGAQQQRSNRAATAQRPATSRAIVSNRIPTAEFDDTPEPPGLALRLTRWLTGGK